MDMVIELTGKTATQRWASWLIAVAGLVYTLLGFGLLALPRWVFENIATFGTFNRHFEGDLGAFLLPLGVGLLWAARAPREHRTLLVVTAVASLIHAVNHGYDAIIGNEALSHWIIDVGPVVVLGVAVAWATWVWRR